MRPFRFAVARVVDAPADIVYHCLADYRHHHRPGGFLPPAFTDLQVLHGGAGAGTVFRFTLRAGGRTRTRTQVVTEPCPGCVLVEHGKGESTSFTVEPRGEPALVRIATVLQARGLERLLLPLLAPLVLRPLYTDELLRLERYARAHIPDNASRDESRWVRPHDGDHQRDPDLSAGEQGGRDAAPDPAI
jgi:Polyketide cyclase / dehydrase and lipid transport